METTDGVASNSNVGNNSGTPAPTAAATAVEERQQQQQQQPAPPPVQQQAAAPSAEEQARLAAESDWLQVEQLQEQRLRQQANQQGGMARLDSSHRQQLTPGTPLSYNEARDYFMSSLPLAEQKRHIVVEPADGGGCCGGLLYALFGTKIVDAALLREREQVFAVAQLAFDDADLTHVRLLQTINMKLTGATLESPRYGSHWELIGFQGNDPSTDLRGVGVLGLLQLLHLVLRHKPLADDLYRLSRDEQQHFPLCIVSLNLTKLCLEALRDRLLNQLVNEHRSVLEAINSLHVAVFSHLYWLWRTQHKTIKDFGFVLKDISAAAKANPARMIDEFSRREVERTSKDSKLEIQSFD